MHAVCRARGSRLSGGATARASRGRAIPLVFLVLREPRRRSSFLTSYKRIIVYSGGGGGRVRRTRAVRVLSHVMFLGVSSRPCLIEIELVHGSGCFLSHGAETAEIDRAGTAHRPHTSYASRSAVGFSNYIYTDIGTRTLMFDLVCEQCDLGTGRNLTLTLRIPKQHLWFSQG